ncbi:MAG: histidine kinase [Candidatus Competibacter denitrificans]
MMRLLQSFNPRRRLAAAIGWVVFFIIVAAAAVGANLASKEAAERARADAERLLAQFATQIRHAIDTALATRLSVLQSTAAQISVDQAMGDTRLRHALQLTALQTQFPEFAWLGIADKDGRLLATTGSMNQGKSVADSAWFQKGRQAPFFGHAEQFPLFAESPDATAARSQGFVMAVPIVPLSGEFIGVLGAALPWQWLAGEESHLLRQTESRRSLELLLAKADGKALLAPPAWLGRSLGSDADLSEEGQYVIGRNLLRPEQQQGPGWIVILRESADTALARAKLAQHTVFRVVFLAGLICAIAVVFITQDLLKRLIALDEQAQAVRQGVLENISIPIGADEISRIGATFADLVGHLQQEKRGLATLNAELDVRVAQRTARIERLADESRHAAITRERLRLARELHDTLSHSLMALLTQIRLIRKLWDRLDPTELCAELAQAEEVAASGLAEARAAITQMRHNSVRDDGLGAALRQLLARFQERSGVAATLTADIQAGGLADERAETVFRIVEEALKNVERHANANTVQINLQWLESPSAAWSNWDPDNCDRIRIEISDDGVGFDPTVPCPGHYGLRGIAEQAELIEARFELHSQPSAGTRIMLEFDA